jgi:hypothetical protein
MASVEDVVGTAANFIGPFLERGNEGKPDTAFNQDRLEDHDLLKEALFHLQTINAADSDNQKADAPYDGSLVGVVYGLLDLITSFGIRPLLSSGVAFGQRPQSVLKPSLLPHHSHSSPIAHELLATTLEVLIPIVEQDGTGVQPLVSQRIIPDIIAGEAELAFSPKSERHSTYLRHYKRLLESTPTSRLFPILTSYLQQDIPSWLRPHLSKELAMLPLRKHGVRHTVEFLSLAYLSKNSQVPEGANGSHSQIPIPLEAIAQASRLLASVPSGMEPTEWFTRLAPQLRTLLDGKEGVELSRAAAQIIAGGILNRRSTGAPGTIGWELFARPTLQSINPGAFTSATERHYAPDSVMVDEQELEVALKRLNVIAGSCSHVGLIKRLLHPVLLPLWGLMEYATSRPSLDALWKTLPRTILFRYMSIACDPLQVDRLATNLFWDGDSAWTFAPGSHGGVEIRTRSDDVKDSSGMGSLFSQLGKLDALVTSFIGLLADANIDDEAVAAIFLRITKRWLSTGRDEESSSTTLTHPEDINPLSALTDAKLSEAMAKKFHEKFARSPQHIAELMGQLLQNYVDEHKARVKAVVESKKPSRTALKNLVNQQSQAPGGIASGETDSEDLVSFALSILHTLITSPDCKLEGPTSNVFSQITPSLQYLVGSHPELPTSPLIINASSNLLQILQPSTPARHDPENPQVQHRAALKSVLAELTSPEPPNRTWALSTLRKLIQDPIAFPLIDIPSTTHLLLSASIADPESYVHTAAIPVLVDLASRAPNPTLRILVNAFVDIDERSLRLKKEQDIQQALDFRLRVGEVLNNFVLDDDYWIRGSNVGTRLSSVKMIVDAVLSIASRRGQRKETLSQRTSILELERQKNEEAEAAWGGPIPNLLDPEGENPAEQAERDALFKIVHGWEDTGIEDDVRIRASALSILSVVFEHRLELLKQSTIDAGLQMALQILVVETGPVKAILRRAAVLVVMGLLKGMDTLLELGREGTAGLGMRQTQEVERVLSWVRDEDSDELVKGHADNVIEGLETWKMKKLFKIRDEGMALGGDLGLGSNLQGLDINPLAHTERKERGRPIVEEVE